MVTDTAIGTNIMIGATVTVSVLMSHAMVAKGNRGGGEGLNMPNLLGGVNLLISSLGVCKHKVYMHTDSSPAIIDLQAWKR